MAMYSTFWASLVGEPDSNRNLNSSIRRRLWTLSYGLWVWSTFSPHMSGYVRTWGFWLLRYLAGFNFGQSSCSHSGISLKSKTLGFWVFKIIQSVQLIKWEKQFLYFIRSNKMLERLLKTKNLEIIEMTV